MTICPQCSQSVTPEGSGITGWMVNARDIRTFHVECRWKYMEQHHLMCDCLPYLQSGACQHTVF